ncbi:MAG: glutaredoxin family protein [Candidatus Planktophila sp.]
MTTVTIYSRKGCHLCQDAYQLLESVREELAFELEIIDIDEDQTLINLYSDQVPVIHIDGMHHDFYKVDLDRFRSSLEKHRQHQ